MQMEELNIAPSAAMRKTVKLYAKFFDSKERCQKLRRIGRDYQTPLQLHIDIMAVLAGLSEGSRRMSSSPSLPRDSTRKQIVSLQISASLAASKPSGSLRESTPAISRKKTSLLGILRLMYC